MMHEKHVMREEKGKKQLDLQRVQTSRSKLVTKSDFSNCFVKVCILLEKSLILI